MVFFVLPIQRVSFLAGADETQLLNTLIQNDYEKEWAEVNPQLHLKRSSENGQANALVLSKDHFSIEVDKPDLGSTPYFLYKENKTELDAQGEVYHLRYGNRYWMLDEQEDADVQETTGRTVREWKTTVDQARDDIINQVNRLKSHHLTQLYWKLVIAVVVFLVSFLGLPLYYNKRRKRL